MASSRARPKQVKFWSSEKELEQIKKKVAKSKLTQSEYLLKSALDKKIIVIDGLKEILIELSREGNNLNQISRSLNQGEQFNQEHFLETKEKLMELWGLIEKILKEGSK
ncbi:MobC family plasmid mobilization relaxosome protein [Clostridium botulinum]|uniref:plasmid mobilization protein n=1 Tax=Clostridium TaxID=1485 RepID=UPI0013F05D80|nr:MULTISPECIES: plasmid mobilization relaxosome protein MobC [Clostridium]MBN1072727.1 plasmid mobilization relaxosome protein MobC [Clostridium botulinum]MCS6112758.1 plasmid mobilization relaxosome protein MobC [Clostridium botulinum]MCS6112782.1 plasmid mobilization relaxosome protein MobC [Clostridium botulinum]NFE13759.1 MobC family plasmid mobilization relaxosome protein [Clostridium botulinum]NFE61320.1 MobC family plasmid mobilization relaxosome protein [Clostridium botulinum]